MGRGLRGGVLAGVAFVLLILLSVMIGATGNSRAGSSLGPGGGSAALPGAIEISEGYIVVNTEGRGVSVLADPDGDVIKSWPDGTMMTVVGPDKDVDGTRWKNVLDPDGDAGWVPERYCFRWLTGSWLVR